MSDTVGQLTIYRYYDPSRIRIEQADPVVDVSGDLMIEIRRASNLAPGCSITTHPGRGEVLTIADDWGKRVVYVIDPVQPTPDTFRMRWVD